MPSVTDLHRSPPHVAWMEARTGCDDSAPKARNAHRDTPAPTHMQNDNALSSLSKSGSYSISLESGPTGFVGKEP